MLVSKFVCSMVWVKQRSRHVFVSWVGVFPLGDAHIPSEIDRDYIPGHFRVFIDCIFICKFLFQCTFFAVMILIFCENLFFTWVFRFELASVYIALNPFLILLPALTPRLPSVGLEWRFAFESLYLWLLIIKFWRFYHFYIDIGCDSIQFSPIFHYKFRFLPCGVKPSGMQVVNHTTLLYTAWL